MNKTVLYLQADMHRAINSGVGTMEVSVLDLKELIAAVMSSEARETAERVGIVAAYINPLKLSYLLRGERFYCTIRRAKNEDFSSPIYCLPEVKVLKEKSEEGIIESA